MNKTESTPNKYVLVLRTCEDSRIVNFHEVKGDARAGVVYCGRATRAGHKQSLFHNPFKGPGSIAKFQAYFLKRVAVDEDFRRAALKLRGKRLGCWCPADSCHTSVILDWLALIR
jgi:Domain of unknown function (DUF4326)